MKIVYLKPDSFKGQVKLKIFMQIFDSHKSLLDSPTLQVFRLRRRNVCCQMGRLGPSPGMGPKSLGSRRETMILSTRCSPSSLNGRTRWTLSPTWWRPPTTWWWWTGGTLRPPTAVHSCQEEVPRTAAGVA